LLARSTSSDRALFSSASSIRRAFPSVRLRAGGFPDTLWIGTNPAEVDTLVVPPSTVMVVEAIVVTITVVVEDDVDVVSKVVVR
jgi:hypothetical protein